MLLMAAAGLLLNGCAGNRPAEQQDSAARRMSIGWIGHDWRVCEEKGSCPRPTSKTVALPAPMPAASRPQVPAQPQPAAAADRKPAVVHFEFARATVTEAGASELEEALPQIRQDETIRVVGHADDIDDAVELVEQAFGLLQPVGLVVRFGEITRDISRRIDPEATGLLHRAGVR